MKFKLAALAFALMLVPAQAGVSPFGTWENVTGESRYTVYQCGTNICLNLTWLRADVQTQTNKPLINTKIAEGKPDGELRWSGIVRYEGQKYSGELRLLSNDSMRVSACSGVFCRTYQLKRI